MTKPFPVGWSYFQRVGEQEVLLLRKHFRIRGDGENVCFAEPLIPQKIIGFYTEYLAKIRPAKLRLEKILPAPEAKILRGLYIGHPDANTLLNLIVRHSLYVDQIVISDPFLDPLYLKGEGDIFKYPEKWVEEIANRALCLCSIQQWIEKGIVLVIPEFSYYYPQELERAVESFTKSGLIAEPDDSLNDKYNLFLKFFVREDPKHRNELFELFSNLGSNFSEDERRLFLEKVQDYEKKNPIRFRLPDNFYNIRNFPHGRFGQIINFSNGIALPLAYPLANLTGSFLLFENPATFETLSSLVKGKDHPNEPFSKLAIAFQQLDFEFLNNVPLEKALELREQGYLQKFRIYLRDLWNTSSNFQSGDDVDLIILEFIDRLKVEYSDLEKEWSKINADLRTNAVIKGMTAGLTAAATGQINLTLGALAGIGVSVLSGLTDYRSFSKDMDNIKKNPLAVFIKLK